MAILKIGLIISEITATRMKISSISTPKGVKGVYVELWQMAKLVLKQSVKADMGLLFLVVASPGLCTPGYFLKFEKKIGGGGI